MKGFVEGTSNITTGDRMKEGDVRRNKFKCIYYGEGRCMHDKSKSKDFPRIYNANGELLCIGSEHCKYYLETKQTLKKTKERYTYIFKIYRNNTAYYLQSITEDKKMVFTENYKEAKSFSFETKSLLKKAGYRNVTLM